MRLAVLSDVHGNLRALQSVIEEVAGSVDGFISLGDVVGYGPENDECLEVVHSLENAIILTGNHEEIFATGDTTHCSELASEFYRVSSRHFTRLDLLEGLHEKRLGRWLFCHTLRSGGEWLYLRDAASIHETLSEDLVVGHTHYQGIVRKDGHVVVNPGSVGQNRVDKGRACYAVFDIDQGSYELKSLSYDHAGMIAAMKRHGYPERLIAYYNADTASENKPHGIVGL